MRGYLKVAFISWTIMHGSPSGISKNFKTIIMKSIKSIYQYARSFLLPNALLAIPEIEFKYDFKIRSMYRLTSFILCNHDLSFSL